MRKFQDANSRTVYVWSSQPSFRVVRRKKSDPNVKETPEEMIHSLKDVFCKGRYRSWAISSENTGFFLNN